MTTATVPAHGTQGVGEPVAQPGRPRPRGSFATAIRDALRRPAILLALGWVVLVVVSSVLAGVLAPHDPLAQDLDNRLAGPSGTYWLGTDELGRDLLSRILHGGGVLLLAALIPVVVAYLLGVPIGMFVGYVGGRADALADFVVNVLFAIPALVVVLAVSVVTDNNLPFMTVVFGVIVSGGIFRLVRASTQASRDLLYVDAARVSGVSRWTILLRHILPNVLGPLIVQGFLLYSGAFLFLTSLSFLGLGFDPQQPSWGQLVFDASAHLDDDPWLMVPIGVVLIATVAALNYLGNSLLATLPTAKRARLLTPPRRPVLPPEAAAGTAPEGRRDPGGGRTGRRGPPAGRRGPRRLLPDPRRRLAAGRGRRLLRRAPGGDPLPRRRVRLRQDDDRAGHARAAARGGRRRRLGPAGRPGAAGRCRSARWPRSGAARSP